MLVNEAENWMGERERSLGHGELSFDVLLNY